VGVPEITPVEVFNVRPSGRPGLTENVMGAVRPAGVSAEVGVMAKPSVAETVWVAGLRLGGVPAESTVMATVVEATPESDPRAVIV
jgi:hypothetical protein